MTYIRLSTQAYSLNPLHYLFLFQIMVLTDPEFESSVLISSDEGASFQKHRLTFYVLSLLFHPTVEDWALAYSHDQKVSVLLMSYFFSVLIQHKSFSISGQTFCQQLGNSSVFVLFWTFLQFKATTEACKRMGTL